jgi:hypothetical protein
VLEPEEREQRNDRDTTEHRDRGESPEHASEENAS